MENEGNKVKGSSKKTPEELFNDFKEANDCPEILQTFQRLVSEAGVSGETPREFYQNLKSKLQSWKSKSLWELLDNRANQKEYSKGTVCEDIHALVIGSGPIGLRTAIELALLGAQVVVVEKRQTFSRNNVLHLWPFLLTDFRSLGAKKFYGKFCSGSIDHISIRRLQGILLKSALVLGVKVYTGVTFEKVIEPTNKKRGWRCSVTPSNHSVSDFELDVLIGADGKKNVLPGFEQIEMRGTLAIGVTANFVNYYSEEEAKVEEISGIAYQFNPGFFQVLQQQKGISLENIVYYKDETHYFVMTPSKKSLLQRGVLKKDFGNPQKLLSSENVNKTQLISYVDDAVDYATKGQLKHRELNKDRKGNADISVFDFTSIKKAKNSARIKERKGHKLLIGLVGDSLLEPFWPTGSGCARGVLSALDAAWMVRSFALDKPPLQILSERENIYRLLSGTSNQNLQKNFDLYTINPSSRYMHIPQKKIQEVYHLYDTDDPVNADFSLGSPTGILCSKGSKKKRVSLTKAKRRRNRRHIKFVVQSSHDSQALSSSCSSTEDLSTLGTEEKVRIAEPKTRPRSRAASENLTSGGEEVHEITKESKRRKKSRKSRSPLSTSSHENQSKIKKSPFDTGVKKKSKKRKTERRSPPTLGNAQEEKAAKRRSFFGFGRGKTKSRMGRKSPRTSDITNENKIVHENIEAEKSSKVESSNGGFDAFGEPVTETPNSQFSRNQPTRRSAREIIAEMEARSRNNENSIVRERNNSSDVPRRKPANLPTPAKPASGKISAKRTKSELDINHTSPSKQLKNDNLWQELSSMSPSAKGAVPALSRMSPEKDENHRHESHDLKSAMGMAGLMAMATPLLIDECTQKGVLYSEKSWFSRNNGRVKDVINKYDSLTGKRLLAKNNSDTTPLRAPMDMVEGPNNRSAKKPTLVEIAQKIAEIQETTSDDKKVDQSSPGMNIEASSWQPTAIAFVEGKTTMGEMETAAKERAMDHSQQEKIKKLRLFKEEFSSLDQESSDSPVKKDFSSPIYKKTFIASVNETPKPKDKADIPNRNKQLETPRDYAKEAGWRKSPALAKKEMERLMVTLTETTSKERAEASIRFLISMFRRIQRNPKEDKFRRIFKSRVKFKKYVWTVRNAKMFMFASGWIEVGSFLIFSAEKNVKEPLAILEKHLSLVASGTSVQISTIKSTLKRDSDSTRTPRAARALPFTLETPKTTSNSSDRETDLTKSQPRSTNRNKEETPSKQEITGSSSKDTPLDKRFSKSVPLNLDSEWDLEMEDPLMEKSLSQSEVKRGRSTSSLFDFTPKKLSRGTTPLGSTPTRTTPVTPDIAIMEEIEGLSNTLDDLMESMEEEPGYVHKSESQAKENVRPAQELKDLCTTLDYMLDSSEEEELDRDLDQWNSKNKPSPLKEGSPATPSSAFSKVPSRRSGSEKISTSKENSNKDDISANPAAVSLSSDLSKVTVQKTKKISLQPIDQESNTSNNSNKSASVPVHKHASKVSAERTNHYSLRSRDKQMISTSSKNSNRTTKPNEDKKISRRKLPSEPDKDSRSISDVQVQKRLSSSGLKSADQPRKEKLTSSNSENTEKGTPEAKPKSQRKVSNESDICQQTKSEKTNEIRKDRPFAINKTKSKSIPSLNDSTSEVIKSSNLVPKSNKRLSSSSKSKSEMDVSGKVNANIKSSKTRAKQKSSSVLNHKHSSSSEASLTVVENDVKSRNIAGSPKPYLEGGKKVLDATNDFKKPDVPKARGRPEISRTGKARESIGEGNLSTSNLDNSLKNRPPTGLERTRSARARRREEIASKLASLETSYESLENSPKRTVTKKVSSSSVESSASSKAKTSSLAEAGNGQQRSLLRRKNPVSRTSSAISRSSVTSEEETHNISKTKRSMSNEPYMRTRNRSDVKRTPSNVSLERKKIDGLLSKEEQDLMRRRSKSASERPGTRATKDNLKRLRLLRSKAVDIPETQRADSSGKGSIRRSGSFKAKHRKEATRASRKNQEDKNAQACNLEQKSATIDDAEEPSRGLVMEESFKSANDSFDDITVVERKDVESVVDGAGNDAKNTPCFKERNESSPFGLRRRQNIDDKKDGIDGKSDFDSNTPDYEELLPKDSTPNKGQKNNEEIPDETRSENIRLKEESDCKKDDFRIETNDERINEEVPDEMKSENRGIQEESDYNSTKDDFKMEFRMQNTGSWMVLDYEGFRESPKNVKKIILSEDLGEKQSLREENESPRASISSLETPKELNERIIDDNLSLSLQISASEDETEVALNHNKENGKVSLRDKDGLENSVSNDDLVPEDVVTDNGIVHSVTGENNEKSDQNGLVTLYANGESPSRTNGEIQTHEPVRKGGFRKRTKGLNEKSKANRMKSQSVENLHSVKNRVTFEEIQNLDVPRDSTLIKQSPKDMKKHVNFPFALRKKNRLSGSCSDLDRSAPEINVQSPSPNKTTSSPDKTYDKKKLAPFKMFKKRKSQDASS